MIKKKSQIICGSCEVKCAGEREGARRREEHTQEKKQMLYQVSKSSCKCLDWRERSLKI